MKRWLIKDGEEGKMVDKRKKRWVDGPQNVKAEKIVDTRWSIKD